VTGRTFSGIDEITELTRDLVEPAMRLAVGRLDPTMQRLCGYHLGWLDSDGSVSERANGGKRLRPILTVLSAYACDGDPLRALPAAVAVELVHNFSLIHDDIMDSDRQRRRQATVWARFGIPAGVLAGDALLGLAFAVLLGDDVDETSFPVVRCLVHTVGELITGQSADLDFEDRFDVDLASGVAMVGAKTAALFQCSASVGALAVAAPQQQVDRLASYGQHLGQAFQAVDDLLGIWGDPLTTGKPVLSDLRTRKKSLPVLAALASRASAGRTLRTLYARPEPFEEADLPEVARLVEEAGGRAWTERRAGAEALAARQRVRQLGAPAWVEDALLAVTDFVAGRDR
jgi:geranylgeranyl diphosphate synthase type I